MASTLFRAGWFVLSGAAAAALHCGGATRSDSANDGGVPTGTSSTGSGTTGTGSGTTGAGGSSIADICKLPMVQGPCDAAVPAYWHDPATGVCVPFSFGGCDGNANNFPSLEACQMACSGTEPNMDACAGPGECALLGQGCCGECNPGSPRSFVAVNRAQAQSFTRIRGCEGISCGACPPISEPESTGQYFIATCDAGRCRVVDIRQTDVTACSTGMDCALRDGANCCEGCDGQGIVAVNRNGSVEKLVCPVPFTSCPPCVPNFPSNAGPVCIDRHCAVAFAL